LSKSRALTEGDYGLKDIADLLLRKGIYTHVLRIRTNANNRGDQKGQLQIISYVSR